MRSRPLEEAAADLRRLPEVKSLLIGLAVLL